MVSLGLLPGGSSAAALAVSSDGLTIVGTCVTTTTVAFRWTAGGGMQSLGLLPGATFSVAQGVSADGSVVVGFSDAGGGGPMAFRWTSAGGMAPLGLISGGSVSQAYAASGPGDVVVGSGNGTGGARAFRWAGAGLSNLGVLYTGVESGARAV